MTRPDLSAVAGVVLMVCGISGLAFAGLNYTKQPNEAQVGALELSVKDTETVDPVGAGIGAIVIGGIVLLAPKQA